MAGLGFIGCIPKKYQEEYIECQLQFLTRVFPMFSKEEQVDFVSVIHSCYDDEIDTFTVKMELNKNNKDYCNRLQECINQKTQERDCLLDRLGARDIVPNKIELCHI